MSIQHGAHPMGGRKVAALVLATALASLLVGGLIGQNIKQATPVQSTPTQSNAQPAEPQANKEVSACKTGVGNADCYWARAGTVFCSTPTAVDEQTGHGTDKAFLDSLGCVELQRSDVTMLKIDTDGSGDIWKVYILGDTMWTWKPING